MSLPRIALRLGFLLAAILLATWLSAAVRDALDIMVMPRNEAAVHRAIMLATAAFIVLLAIPFVPGAEIGLTMLAMFGADIAPLVYGATVTALMLAYGVGRIVPPDRVVRALRALGLSRAAEAVARSAALPRAARLDALLAGSPPRLLRLSTRFRYLAILVAVNLPGNFLIGGGGGISMMAGMSGLFAPLPFFLTVAVAVSPVPLAILLFGG